MSLFGVSWSVFSGIRTEYGPKKKPSTDTFHAVHTSSALVFSLKIIPHHDQSSIFYYCNIIFRGKILSIQYNIALAIARVIRGKRFKNHQSLGNGSHIVDIFQCYLWALEYLYQLIPFRSYVYNTTKRKII